MYTTETAHSQPFNRTVVTQPPSTTTPIPGTNPQPGHCHFIARHSNSLVKARFRIIRNIDTLMPCTLLNPVSIFVVVDLPV
jgi:hypothetical protein